MINECIFIEISGINLKTDDSDTFYNMFEYEALCTIYIYIYIKSDTTRHIPKASSYEIVN